MAKISQVKRQQKQEKKLKFTTRKYNRCSRCGRSRGYVGKLGICRCCIKDCATKGEIPGLKKSSW
ncbi:MAG: type Z 30S ribosomal protein S14 [Mycoplasmataceae bacterium]|nr:type Z 30S ribosomal protein S14 [Mycoplasmataceae bacterium]